MGAWLFLSPGSEPSAAVAGDRVGVVAHRGAGGGASPVDRPPENSLAACQWGWARAPWVECDVMLSGDGAVVSTHDFSTKRFADRDVVVTESSLETLQELDMGSWKDPRWKGTRISTLGEILEAMPADRGIVIEIKSGPEAAAPVAKAIASAGVRPDQVMIISFNLDTMRAVKQKCPGVSTMWLMSFKHEVRGEDTKTWTVSWRTGPGRGVSRKSVADIDALVATAVQEGFDGLDTTVAQPPGLTSRLSAAGLFHGVWTINDPGVAVRLARSGVNEITTDHPEAIREALADAGFEVGRWNRRREIPPGTDE
ncbi:MAG: hypothetical protein MK116_10385 [Phycisphaerales bacterium]|nr:hypothetical protein [Phycisphaerales bacterium]